MEEIERYPAFLLCKLRLDEVEKSGRKSGVCDLYGTKKKGYDGRGGLYNILDAIHLVLVKNEKMAVVRCTSYDEPKENNLLKMIQDGYILQESFKIIGLEGEGNQLYCEYSLERKTMEIYGTPEGLRTFRKVVRRINGRQTI